MKLTSQVRHDSVAHTTFASRTVVTKLKSGFSLLQILMVIAIIGILAALTIPNVHAQVAADNRVAVTNQPAIVTTTASSNIVSWVPLFNTSEVSLEWVFNQASASTSNATLNVRMSVDGTNVLTDTFASITRASTGTTNVRAGTNWNHSQLAAYKALIVYSIDNTTALTTLTNKSIIVRRTPQ